MSYYKESILKYKDEKRAKPHPEKPSTGTKKKPKNKDYKYAVVPTFKPIYGFTLSWKYVKLDDAEKQKDKLNREWARLDITWEVIEIDR